MVSTTGTTEDASWTPVLQMKDGSYLGIRGGGDVWIGTHRSPHRAVDNDTPSELLVLLERPYEDVRADLLQAANFGQVPGYFESRVPLARIPYAAFSMKSDYWMGLGLEWVEDMPVRGFLDLLSSVQDARWASQPVRHRARQLLKSYRI